MITKLLWHFTALVFVFVNIVSGQIVYPGNCPTPSTHPTMNPAQFILKPWYIIRRYPSAFEENTKCSFLEIKPSKSGALQMNFRGVSTVDGSVTNTAGKAYFDHGELSKLKLQIPFNSWNSVNDVHFWVIYTDYTNYTLAWSCDQLCDGFRREQVWFMSRRRTIEPEAMNAIINKYFTGNSIFNANYLVPVNQDKCPSVAVLKNVNNDDDLLFYKK